MRVKDRSLDVKAGFSLLATTPRKPIRFLRSQVARLQRHPRLQDKGLPGLWPGHACQNAPTRERPRRNDRSGGHARRAACCPPPRQLVQKINIWRPLLPRETQNMTCRKDKTSRLVPPANDHGSRRAVSCNFFFFLGGGLDTWRKTRAQYGVVQDNSMLPQSAVLYHHGRHHAHPP